MSPLARSLVLLCLSAVALTACTTPAVDDASGAVPVTPLLTDGLPDPCSADRPRVSDLIGDDLGEGRAADLPWPGCRWTTAGGEAVVVSRSWVGDWMAAVPDLFAAIRSSDVYDAADRATLEDLRSRVQAGDPLDRGASCGLYGLVLQAYGGLADDLPRRVDPDAGVIATFVEDAAGRHTVQATRCDEGVLTRVSIEGTGPADPEEEMARSLEVAASLSDGTP
ncbi:hypothetical protein [Isoptericola sediminis]|uniref:DUF3558 domain-containing protein n=1 Tax=Isoptericola sediminis TaxID=2733572 RepID=A0A849KCI1_9MICO|nr:hypothetical protein [Isoptericola sediminis]NNU26293.1 hypothetical protein [Isoptericola sediminis]